MFKDHDKINQRTQLVYASNIRALANAVREYGLQSKELRLFLLEGAEPEKTPHCPNHNGCSYRNAEKPADQISVTEKRICRCMYYFNRPDSTKTQRAKCERCDFPGKRRNISSYTVLDYEVPMPYVVRGAGGIDLLVQSPDSKIYAVEVKPDDSKETLVRMIAEILTYCEISDYSVVNHGHLLPVHPAICFFKNSQQWDDYIEMQRDPDLLYLLGKIKLFYIAQDDVSFTIHDAEENPICR